MQDRDRKNRRTGFVLFGVALAFFVAILVKRWMQGH